MLGHQEGCVHPLLVSNNSPAEKVRKGYLVFQVFFKCEVKKIQRLGKIVITDEKFFSISFESTIRNFLL